MLFGKTIEQWKETGASHTAAEIAQQPATWRKTLNIIRENKEALAAFLSQITNNEDYDIVFTGAGTSEYVGNAAMHALSAGHSFHVRSHGSTDVVVAPQKYFSETKPTLLVSFARSGESKESMGTIRAAEIICSRLYHLVITCNAEGTLAREAAKMENCFLIQLPPETNDRGMAMTSSFSNMYLAVLCALQLDRFEEFAAGVEEMCTATERLIENYEPLAQIVDSYNFERLVYLGSAELKEIGHEAMLKLLELTVGEVAPLFDTPIGFRHGPKSILNDKTLTVLMLPDEPLARRYDKDMLNELFLQKDGNFILALNNLPDEEVSAWSDLCLCFNTGRAAETAVLGLGYVVAGQILALLKSQKLGFATDRPEVQNARNKLVKGITIYPYEK